MTTIGRPFPPAGPVGPQGPAGAPGPNSVSTATATSLSGLLKGDGSHVAIATAGTDYVAPGGLGTAAACNTGIAVGNVPVATAYTANTQVYAYLICPPMLSVGDPSGFAINFATSDVFNPYGQDTGLPCIWSSNLNQSYYMGLYGGLYLLDANDGNANAFLVFQSPSGFCSIQANAGLAGPTTNDLYYQSTSGNHWFQDGGQVPGTVHTGTVLSDWLALNTQNITPPSSPLNGQMYYDGTDFNVALVVRAGDMTGFADGNFNGHYSGPAAMVKNGDPTATYYLGLDNSTGPFLWSLFDLTQSNPVVARSDSSTTPFTTYTLLSDPTQVGTFTENNNISWRKLAWQSQ